jgi:hypothetical protein
MILTAEEVIYLPQLSGGNWMGSTAEPVEGANNNVAFPRAWSHWKCARWRYLNDCPGCGWTYESGFAPVGVQTHGNRLAAAFLNWWHR